MAESTGQDRATGINTRLPPFAPLGRLRAPRYSSPAMRQQTSPRTGLTFVTDEQPDKASGSPARRRMTNSVFFLAGAAACLLLAGMQAVTFTEPISIRGDHSICS